MPSRIYIGDDGKLRCERLDSNGNVVNEYELGYEPDDREWILSRLRMFPKSKRESLGIEYKDLYRALWIKAEKDGCHKPRCDHLARLNTNTWLREKADALCLICS